MIKYNYKYNPELVALLESYARRESGLQELCDQLYPYLEDYFYKNARYDWELTGEVLAYIYEVQDGVTEETAFRRVIEKFLTSPRACCRRKGTGGRRPVITLGRPGRLPDFRNGKLSTATARRRRGRHHTGRGYPARSR